MNNKAHKQLSILVTTFDDCMNNKAHKQLSIQRLNKQRKYQETNIKCIMKLNLHVRT